MNYKDIYSQWLKDEYFDENTRQELESIKEDEREIEERFYKNLDFGTGGLRGIIGAGINRMNIYTVRKATQGLANYIVKNGEKALKKGVAIAYDSRRFSKEFSEAAALVLCGNGIKTYLFESLRPTPVLSFAVRELGCTAGIVVTASHNPPEYNGYKVYWDDGAQVLSPMDTDIINEVNSVVDFSEISHIPYKEAIDKGLLKIIGSEIDDAFTKCSLAQCLNRDIEKDIKIVFTPLNGAGNLPVRRVLREAGFDNVFVVPEQELPDPDFTTIGYPNPEDPKAFTYGVKLLEKKSADIVVATDPDCDRASVVIKHDGEYIYFSGNSIGVLLTEYILSHKKENGSLPKNAAVISTIVSTNMTDAVCKAYDTAFFEVLTGFKYIGERIREFESDNSYSYIFGFEESIGYLPGTHARDKDAVTAVLLICEMAAVYKNKGMDIYDGLLELYKKYGYCKESTKSITLSGLDGIENIKKIMASLRNNPPTTVNDIKVIEFRDYLTGVIKDSDENHKPTGLPTSDVLYYVLEDESWFCVRPSGTEPKIKLYFGVKGQSSADADIKMNALLTEISAKVEAIVK